MLALYERASALSIRPASNQNGFFVTNSDPGIRQEIAALATAAGLTAVDHPVQEWYNGRPQPPRVWVGHTTNQEKPTKEEFAALVK